MNTARHVRIVNRLLSGTAAAFAIANMAWWIRAMSGRKLQIMDAWDWAVIGTLVIFTMVVIYAVVVIVLAVWRTR